MNVRFCSPLSGDQSLLKNFLFNHCPVAAEPEAKGRIRRQKQTEESNIVSGFPRGYAVISCGLDLLMVDDNNSPDSWYRESGFEY
ncbi:hypothetical protein NPIL_411821 [Nephila pilipes]|uniref:Uncharacterized protein n=1 Tax=Nephila pilipes TaxID=299642 RepID=A0A8X6UEI2_NEPPI|nr:hypothetical protein NPIL_411821 [Nephila pilipes]